MKIHTLGPEQTDSSEACDYYRNERFPDAKIVLHESFESILEHLEEYRGDLCGDKGFAEKVCAKGQAGVCFQQIQSL